VSKTNKKTPTTLADQIRDAINQSDWSISSIAAAAGIPQPVLYRFATGDRVNVRMDTAEKLVALFQMRLTKAKRLKL